MNHAQHDPAKITDIAAWVQDKLYEIMISGSDGRFLRNNVYDERMIRDVSTQLKTTNKPGIYVEGASDDAYFEMTDAAGDTYRVTITRV